MTHPDDNTLAMLVDGALDDAARADVERHLDTCVACSELVSELAWVVTPMTREAPPGYRFVRERAGKVWEAARLDDSPPVEFGFGGPWPPTLAAVRDRHVAEVYAIGREGDRGFIAYEPSVRTFREWCRQEPRSTDAIIAAWRDALRGIAALHAKGFVHGRVSPDHICVAKNGRVFVGAYARELGKASGYLAPEQLAGKPATAASDQFAACVVLWEMLADKKPFVGATAGALAIVMTSPPARPARAHPAFVALERGLAADPGARWPSVEVLAAAALERRPRSMIWLVAGVIVAIALCLVLAR